jgi:hypothetical protein
MAKDDHKDNVIGLDELGKQTKEVLSLAKYTVLYAVSAINIAESQREISDKRTPTINYGGKPGDVFL